MGLTGGMSPASSSSESSSLETGIWVIFLGLNGLTFVDSADLTAALVVRLPAAPPRLAGRPLIPGRAGSVASSVGSMFSLSGSWNLTAFLIAGLEVPIVFVVLVVVVVVVAAAVRVRVAVVFFTGAAGAGSSAAATAFRGRPLVGLAGAAVSLGGSVAVFFNTRPRIGFAGPSDLASDSCSSAFLGLPRVLLTAADSRCSSSSSSFSSARVFLLAVVLFVPAVAVLFARAAAVTIFVVFTEGSVALAAALARVILLGGDSMIKYFAVLLMGMVPHVVEGLILSSRVWRRCWATTR
ncbi:hypothetical protein HG530_011208 [Fusarium avenaceum]|nr:hypothetical protein HG530_011208 [Fusarium avenaceum]